MLIQDDFKELTNRFMISGEGRIMEKKKDGKFCDVTGDIYEKLIIRGANYDDIWQLLKLYLYFNDYVRPYDIQTTQAGELIDGLTYGQITGISQDAHESAFWYLPLFAGNRKAHNLLVLRRGSEAQWVKGGEYVRQSLIAEDHTPQFAIHRPTHAFAKGSPTAKYNWVYGRYPMDGDNEGVLRFYFNVDLGQFNLIRLIQNIQKIFDLYEIPFKLKFLACQPEKGRADPVVLYVERKYPFVVFFLIRDIFKTSQKLLLTDVPLFVKKLGDGLGFAEDPTNSDSFGMFTCELLTDALIFAKGKTDDKERFEQVIEYICNHRGLEPDQIYRGTAQKYNYDKLFELFNSPRHRVSSRLRLIRIRLLDEGDFFDEPGAKRTRFLIASIRIAYQLCKEAFWAAPEKEEKFLNDWQCNWLTFRTEQSALATKYDNSTEEQLHSAEKYADQTQESFRLDKEQFSLRAAYYACTPIEKHQIAFFLKKVGKFYPSDLFNKTIKFSDSKFLSGPIHPGEFDWPDENLNQAWIELFGLKPNGLQAGPNEKPDLEAIGDHLINYYMNTGRPFGNCFITETPEQNTYFCPTLTHGLAGVGYFFLYLYDRQIKLPYQTQTES